MATFLAANGIALLQLDLLVAITTQVLCDGASDVERNTRRGVICLGILLGWYVSFALRHGKRFTVR